MGIADRDYMREPPANHRSIAPRASWAVAAAVTVSLVASAFVLRAPLHIGHGRTTFVPAGVHRFHLGGPTTAHTGTVVSERGTLPAGVSGTVVVLARWNHGVWVQVATVTTNDNTYFVSFPLNQPGVVDVQLNLPNGDQGTSTITVTGASIGSAAWPTPGATA
jgi:hypothetical protein